jgi:hypothetical protein
MFNILRLILSVFLAMSSFARVSQAGSQLVEKTCASFDSEKAILLSEIKAYARDKNLSERESFEELINNRAMLAYAKKQIWYNNADVQKTLNQHKNDLLKKTNLTEAQFAERLEEDPYNISFSRYLYGIEFFIIKNQLTSTIKDTDISESDIQAALNKKITQMKKRYDITFVSVLVNKETKDISGQLQKAKLIKNELLQNRDLDAIKRRYSSLDSSKNTTDVAIIGPISYKGNLKEEYEKKLLEHAHDMIIGPFDDNGKQTLIVRTQAKLPADYQKTALEEVRKELYEQRVNQRIGAAIASSNVLLTRNCVF